jgi:peptidoglycan hydrolase FlgJ
LRAVSIPKTEAPAAYTDLAGLSKLKRAAGTHDPAAIRAVAQQFESMFTRMMLKSMREASGKDPIFGSDQEQMYQDMADDQLSVQMAKGKGLGLADMLVRQLQKMGVKGADAAGGSTGASAGAKAAAAYSATQRASAISGASAGSATSASPGASEAEKTNFVQGLWPQAEQAGQLLGVDPRHLIAQAALETNWGRNVPRDSAGRSSNNLFGMKASADWSGSTVTSNTQEFQSGVATSTAAQFKAYATPAESLQDYVSLLRNNPRYSSALNTGGDVQAFATGLQRGGYATDPDYANKIAAFTAAVAHKVNDVVASSSSVSDLKLAAAVPISANTGAL